MSRVKRYEWEDALIEAQAMGVIDNRDLTAGLKLAHAITWLPKDGGPSALGWKNDLAFEVVGLGRSTFYKGLTEQGYLVLHKNNLTPVIPESHSETRKQFIERREALIAKHADEEKSLSETTESLVETTESLTETGKSLGDNPYSVDIYSGDTSSVDIGSVASVADAPEAATSEIQVLKDDSNDSTSSLEVDISEPSLPTGTVNPSTSHESELPDSLEPLNEAGLRSVPEQLGAPAEPARPARRKASTFSKGELQMAFRLLGASQGGAFGWPPNFEAFEKRIKQGGFEHLDTAQGQLLAAYEVILNERKTA